MTNKWFIASSFFLQNVLYYIGKIYIAAKKGKTKRKTGRVYIMWNYILFVRATKAAINLE